MGRIIREDDLIALITGKVEALEEQNELAKTSNNMAAHIQIGLNKAKIDVLNTVLKQMPYIMPYEPRPMHELLAEDAAKADTTTTEQRSQ